MRSVVEWGLANAATAAILAMCVAVITRVWRNPHLAHLLWLIVLLRLVAPPVVQVPLPTFDWRGSRETPATAVPTVDVPDVAITESSTVRRAEVRESAASAPMPTPSASHLESSLRLPVPTQTTGPTQQTATAADRPASDALALSTVTSFPVWDMLAGAWISGSVLYAALMMVRVQRFGREIRRSSAVAPDWLTGEIREISRSVALPRIPRVHVIDWTLPPMIWSGVRPTLLVPRALVESIDPARRRLLLLHELLHVRRRDPLTRWFAVAVLAVYWWNPFCWWAVRKLQNSQEECCDAAVLCFYPQQSETYGEALLAVSEFVSCGSLLAPAVSVGVERKNHLKRRMTMILEGSRWPKLSKARLAVATSCGALALAVSLTRVAAEAGSTDQDPTSSTTQTLPAAKADQVVRSNGSDGPAMLAPNPLSQPAPGDGDVRKLLKDRYRVALVTLQREFRESLTDPLAVSVANIGVAGRTLLDCELALAGPRDKPAIYERYIELTMLLDQRAEGLLKAKLISLEDLQAAHERRLDAETKLRQCREGSLPVLENQKEPLETSAQDAFPLGDPTAQLAAKSAQGSLSAEIFPDPSIKPLEPAAGDDELRKLLKERYNSALKAFQGQYVRTLLDPTTPITTVILAGRTFVDAELAVRGANDVIAVHERYLNLTRYFEKRAEAMVEKRVISRADFDAVRAARLDAEIKLVQAKAAHPPSQRRAGVYVQELQVRVRIAEAEVAAARAVGQQGEAELKRALANLKYRETQHLRVQSLRKQNAVNQNEVDDATHLRDDAASSVVAARASIAAAQAQVAIKVAQLEQVELELKQASEAGQ
jgi:beta-lactamase regulating signal transducer with metallopeptidase domain